MIMIGGFGVGSVMFSQEAETMHPLCDGSGSSSLSTSDCLPPRNSRSFQVWFKFAITSGFCGCQLHKRTSLGWTLSWTMPPLFAVYCI